MKRDRLSNEYAALAGVVERLEKGHFAHVPLVRIRQAADALKDVVNMDVPGETPAQRAQRWHGAADMFRVALDRTKQALTADELGSLSSLAQQRVEALGLETDRYANEIVRAFGAAGQAERVAMLKAAVDARDGRTLAALVEAPEFVTKVDRGMLDQFLGLAETKHAPHVAERRQKFEEAMGTVRVALQTAETIAARAVDARELREAAEAERLEKDAQKRLADATAAD